MAGREDGCQAIHSVRPLRPGGHHAHLLWEPFSQQVAPQQPQSCLTTIIFCTWPRHSLLAGKEYTFVHSHVPSCLSKIALGLHRSAHSTAGRLTVSSLLPPSKKMTSCTSKYIMVCMQPRLCCCPMLSQCVSLCAWAMLHFAGLKPACCTCASQLRLLSIQDCGRQARSRRKLA